MYCDDDKGNTDLYGAIRIHAEILSTLKMSQKLSENEQELQNGLEKKSRLSFGAQGKSGGFLSLLMSF